MKKILIADKSEDLCAVLARSFRRNFKVFSCHDGARALELARQERPDILVLDLFLPQLDGLTVLRELSDARPPAVLALSDVPSGYVYQSATDLGAKLIMLRPFRAQAVYSHVMLLLDYLAHNPVPAADPQTIAAAHMQLLKLPNERDGFQQLRLAIPLFAQDPSLRLSKELYPEVARLFGASGEKTVERSIRATIKDAWKIRDAALWERYFPGFRKCPTNKQFIACIAQYTQMPEL